MATSPLTLEVMFAGSLVEVVPVVGGFAPDDAGATFAVEVTTNGVTTSLPEEPLAGALRTMATVIAQLGIVAGFTVPDAPAVLAPVIPIGGHVADEELPCPLCPSYRTEAYLTVDRLTTWVCRDCGHTFDPADAR